MNRILTLAGMLAVAATLGGCIAATPSAGGASVRAILASQALPPQPQPQPERGSDAAAAVAAYANYQRSYVTPTSQADSPTFGK